MTLAMADTYRPGFQPEFLGFLLSRTIQGQNGCILLITKHFNLFPRNIPNTTTESLCNCLLCREPSGKRFSALSTLFYFSRGINSLEIMLAVPRNHFLDASNLNQIDTSCKFHLNNYPLFLTTFHYGPATAIASLSGSINFLAVFNTSSRFTSSTKPA